jgi:Na+:H+ antiporter, NhaA family
MRVSVIAHFLKLEAASGILLFMMAALAILICNSPWAGAYQHFWQTIFSIHVADYNLTRPVLFWVNEGFMSIFFLLVGLELKREFLVGELAELSQIYLPAAAALGGMLVPALIYTAFNHEHPYAINGWSIPVATDIAFAVGVLSLFGKRIPLALKLFLMALAIFDDVGAIFIIAISHTHSLSYLSLFLAVALLIILFVLNYFNVRYVVVYLIAGTVLWACVLKSGVHATVAGVLLAFFIPLTLPKANLHSPLLKLENLLHPWVAYGVMPLFAFANAGLSFSGLSLSLLSNHVVLGIALGLFLGKQIGVISFSSLLIRLGWAKLPAQTTWLALYGVAILCGIGFTMSLFLGTLAFKNNTAYLMEVRLGVLLGSLASGLIGAMVLQVAQKWQAKGTKFE